MTELSSSALFWFGLVTVVLLYARFNRCQAHVQPSPNSGKLVRNAGASKRGYFLRAEMMHGFCTVDKFGGSGLWILDEPQSFALTVRQRCRSGAPESSSDDVVL